MDLSKYKIPLSELQDNKIQIINRKVIEREFIDFRNSNDLINLESVGDGIYKNKENSYLIKCTTEFIDVTPKMINWWFSWHLPCSDRYKLWHPRDHVSARLIEAHKELQSRGLYIGTDSYVEEYIGNKLQKLKISFQEPRHFGLENNYENATAVCAFVTDSRKEVRIAKILHYLSKENNKSSLKSFFWLGEELNHPNAIINMLLRLLSNFHYIKRFFINDKLARDLLTHCYEEMDHLSKFLPSLYSDLGIEQKSKKLDIPL
tara:strand:+ start:533 stop:1315 length:783 start_codon:yes stop_codon:yes gene_type:complete